MNISDLLSMCDHTELKQTATIEDIYALCDAAIKYKTASVCIPPCFVKQAKEYVKNAVKICTVVGFPNGYSTTAVKEFETAEAIKNGADEIDMVINIGALKNGDYGYVLNEITAIKKICGKKILKVIIESCLLNKTEKIKMCELVTLAGADFIKTSTGFSSGGATFGDVELLKNNVGSTVQVKAAGGIGSIADAEKFVKSGATRLGTSKIVKIVEENIK